MSHEIFRDQPTGRVTAELRGAQAPRLPFAAPRGKQFSESSKQENVVMAMAPSLAGEAPALPIQDHDGKSLQRLAC